MHRLQRHLQPHAPRQPTASVTSQTCCRPGLCWPQGPQNPPPSSPLAGYVQGGIAFSASSFRLQAAGSSCGGGPKTSLPVAAILTGTLVAAALQSF